MEAWCAGVHVLGSGKYHMQTLHRPPRSRSTLNAHTLNVHTCSTLSRSTLSRSTLTRSHAHTLTRSHAHTLTRSHAHTLNAHALPRLVPAHLALPHHVPARSRALVQETRHALAYRVPIVDACTRPERSHSTREVSLMPAITKNFGSGGGGLTPNDSAGQPSLAVALRASVDDVAALRAALVALLAKLDADGGVTDTDYASTLTPAAQTLTKG